MDRRTYLSSCGVAATMTLAGCGGASDPSDDTDSGTTTEPVPSVAGQSIVTGQTGCGTADGEASVTFDAEALSVDLSGVMTAGDPCHDAVLAGVSYAAEADTLTVTVDTAARDEICPDCVARIEYAGSVTFEGSLPGRVVVDHGVEGTQRVADVTRSVGD